MLSKVRTLWTSRRNGVAVRKLEKFVDKLCQGTGRIDLRSSMVSTSEYFLFDMGLVR